jgi:hypothetical protein
MRHVRIGEREAPTFYSCPRNQNGLSVIQSLRLATPPRSRVRSVLGHFDLSLREPLRAGLLRDSHALAIVATENTVGSARAIHARY